MIETLRHQLKDKKIYMTPEFVDVLLPRLLELYDEAKEMATYRGGHYCSEKLKAAVKALESK